MIRSPRLLGAGLVACAAFLAAPASGHALTGATITDDAGAQVPLVNGAALRNMTPFITPQFAPNETRFAFSITSPNGGTDTTTCGSVASYTGNGLLPYKVAYTGSGVYTVTIKAFTEAQYQSSSCRGNGTGTFTAAFTIAPSVSLGTFPTKLLTRKPSGKKISPTIQYAVPVNQNPGADANELVINGPGIPPEGSVRGVDPATGTAPVFFFGGPGTYTLTPRATDYGFSQGPVLGAAVAVRVLDPFDIGATGFIDSRGPVYKWFGVVRTKFIGRAKLKFQVRRKGTKRFRTVSKAKVRKNRSITFRMKITRRAKYQYRIKYKGNSKVARGGIKGSFRIRSSRI